MRYGHTQVTALCEISRVHLVVFFAEIKSIRSNIIDCIWTTILTEVKHDSLKQVSYFLCIVVLSPVYTIQPVVKPVAKPVWQPGELLLLLTAFINVCIHDTTGCQTRLTTGWMFVYTIQPVVQPVWQPVVSCKQGFTFTRFLVCSFFFHCAIFGYFGYLAYAIHNQAPYAIFEGWNRIFSIWTSLLITLKRHLGCVLLAFLYAVKTGAAGPAADGAGRRGAAEFAKHVTMTWVKLIYSLRIRSSFTFLKKTINYIYNY